VLTAVRKLVAATGRGSLRPGLGCLLAALALLVPGSLRGAVAGSSTRTGPACYRAGQSVTLTNLMAPLASVWMQTLTERVPAGWTTSDISDGGSFDAPSGSIRWMFFDNQVRQLRYTLLAPANAAGPVSLSGTASFDGATLTVGGLLQLAAAPPASGTVVRNLPDTYRGGVGFTVTLAVTPEADVELHTVDEIVPVGWTVTSVSHAGTAFANGTVRWGPFVDADARDLSYVVQAPVGSVTNAAFRGTGSFGQVSVTTAGDTNVAPVPEMGGIAARDLPVEFSPGTPFTLSIEVSPHTNTLFWIVSEMLPSGWAASNISHGGSYSAVLQQVQWGPFIDSTPLTLTCSLIPPGNAIGVAVFSGQAQFDTLTVQTGGDSQSAARLSGGGSVVRQLPRYYLPRQSLPVVLAVVPSGDVSAQGVDDVFPAGWIVDPASVTGGGLVLTNEGKVRWLFLDGLPHDLAYTITPPGDAAGEARFAGQGTFGGVTSLAGGSTNIFLQPGGTAARSLPGYFVPGLPVDVVVDVVTDTNVVFLTVIDMPPTGWLVDSISHGGSFDPTNGIVRWIMEAGASPTALAYRAWPPDSSTNDGRFDGTAFFDGRAIPVAGDTNLPVNLPPTVSLIPDQTTLESVPVLMAILVTDPETATGDLTIELTHTNTVLLPPENLTMNRVGNVIYLGLTPKPRRHGTDWFTLRVSDGVSTVTRQFSWTVEDVADPLVIAPIAAHLNGAGYCALPAITGLGGATTIEAWVYPKSHVADAVIAELGNGASGNNLVLCASEGTTGKPRFFFRSGVAVAGSVTAPEAIPLNTWTHLAGVVQTNGTILLYVNGLEMATGAASPLPPAVTRADNFIGRSSGGGGWLNGALTDVRIWNVARTEAQIEAGRSIGSIAGPEAGLLAAYPMGATGAAPLADVSGNSRQATLGGSISFYKSDARTLSISGFTGSSSLYVDQGTLILNGTNSYTGTTTINAGTLQVGVGGTDGTLGSGNVVNNSLLVLNRSDDLTLPNAISGTGSVTKQGAGVVTLAGTNSYSGSTIVSAGTLRVSGRLANSGVTVAPAAILGGTGSIAGHVTVQGTLAPGVSPGILNVGDVAWTANAAYEWEINNAAGTAGVDWDLLNVTGSLDIQATPANPFTIKMVALSGTKPGPMAGFRNTQSNEWRIATVSGSIAGFNAASFIIDTNQVSNDLKGGILSVRLSGDSKSLVMAFTPVVSNHPPVTPSLAYPRGYNLTLKIPMTVVLAACSDPDGDTLTLVGVSDTSTEGASVRISGSYIQYYNAPNNNSDSFSYTVTDGVGGSSTGVINVTAVQSVGISLSATMSGGQIKLMLAGIPGYHYQVLRSTNAVNWESVPAATLTMPALGVLDWADPSPLWPSGFYRLRQGATP